MFHIVSATRKSNLDFWTKTALGISLLRLKKVFEPEYHVFYDNKKGLPELYNSVIDSVQPGDIVIFCHDDIWINDSFFVSHLLDGLSNFDIIGVVGCQIRIPFQVNWAFASRDIETRKSTWMNLNTLSGSIIHEHDKQIHYYGETKKECKILDGCFLAANAQILIDKDIRFDERFKFHCYDTDFCRSAESKNVSMGTWTINLSHQSTGKVPYGIWDQEFALFREKWKD